MYGVLQFYKANSGKNGLAFILGSRLRFGLATAEALSLVAYRIRQPSSSVQHLPVLPLCMPIPRVLAALSNPVKLRE